MLMTYIVLFTETYPKAIRCDVKIYYQSVEMDDSNKIDEYANLEQSTLAFQIYNYDSLCDNFEYIRLDYFELMRRVKGELPEHFFKKYVKFLSIEVTNDVRSKVLLACDFLKVWIIWNSFT